MTNDCIKKVFEENPQRLHKKNFYLNYIIYTEKRKGDGL